MPSLEKKISKGTMMKRTVAFVFSMLGVAGLLFAQNGYKNLSWGMSVAQVEKEVGQLTTSSDLGDWGFHRPLMDTVLGDAMLFFNQNLTSQGLSPNFSNSTYPFPYQSKAVYDKSDTDLMCGQCNSAPIYFFVEGKLVAVEVGFAQTDVLPMLLHEYGDTTPYYVASDIFGQYQVACWYSGDRLVTWDSIQTLYGGVVTESVAYIDRSWFEQIEKETLAAFKAATSSLD